MELTRFRRQLRIGDVYHEDAQRLIDLADRIHEDAEQYEKQLSTELLSPPVVTSGSMSKFIQENVQSTIIELANISIIGVSGIMDALIIQFGPVAIEEALADYKRRVKIVGQRIDEELGDLGDHPF